MKTKIPKSIEIYDSQVYEAVKTKQGILIRKFKKLPKTTSNKKLREKIKRATQ